MFRHRGYIYRGMTITMPVKVNSSHPLQWRPKDSDTIYSQCREEITDNICVLSKTIIQG